MYMINLPTLRMRSWLFAPGDSDKKMNKAADGEADIVILDADPIADLRNSERVTHTILGGTLYEASTMDRMWPNPAPRAPLSWEIDGGQTDPAKAESTGCSCARH